jgi:hypothetical protein
VNKHQEYIKSVLDHIAKGGKMVFDRRPRRSLKMSIEQRLEIQIIDKVEQQTQHCLREYEGDLLEDKLIDLVKEWFFKGFTGGLTYEREQRERTMKADPQAVPSNPAPQYLMLDEEDFKCLVRGGVLKVGNELNIALRDIGFCQMDEAIDSASRGVDTYKDRQKVI